MTDQPMFTGEEVKISNRQTWNTAVNRCRSVINQLAEDYQEMGAAMVARQLRVVSHLLKNELREESQK